jgi:hypothetical protein
LGSQRPFPLEHVLGLDKNAFDCVAVIAADFALKSVVYENFDFQTKNELK